MDDLVIITPPVADQREQLDFGLVSLTEAIYQLKPESVGGGFLGGQFGYGAHWDDEIFMMHPYCWCEEACCPWCSGCECVPPSEQYVDGKRVESWYDATKDTIPDYGDPRFSAAIAARDARVKIIYPEISHSCGHKWATNQPRREDFGVLQTAPNFWHKRSGLKVHWYKWIGRDMQVFGPQSDIATLMQECMESLSVFQKPKSTFQS